MNRYIEPKYYIGLESKRGSREGDFNGACVFLAEVGTSLGPSVSLCTPGGRTLGTVIGGHPKSWELVPGRWVNVVNITMNQCWSRELEQQDIEKPGEGVDNTGDNDGSSRDVVIVEVDPAYNAERKNAEDVDGRITEQPCGEDRL